MQPDSSNQERINDLSPEDVTTAEAERVKGGAMPPPPPAGPVPIPYPNLKLSDPRGIVPCL